MCIATLQNVNTLWNDAPGGIPQGTIATDAGTIIETLYRSPDNAWNFIVFTFNGDLFAGWATATDPSLITYATVSGGTCNLSIHPDYVPTPTFTPTPSPTNTPSPTATLTPSPTPIVGIPALPLHSDYQRFGLPQPFNTLPFDTSRLFARGIMQGYGPNSFAILESPGLYSGTHGLHPGFDYFNESAPGDFRFEVTSLCDGIVVQGRNSGGGTTRNGLGLSIWCFADYGNTRDPDGDGIVNMSNIVVVYNHLNNKLVEDAETVVRRGQVLATTTQDGSGFAHLDLQIYFARGYRDGSNRIQINPLFVYGSSGLEQHNFDVYLQPYFPVDRRIKLDDGGYGIAINPLGINPGEIDRWSLGATLGDGTDGTNNFPGYQDDEAPGVEWWPFGGTPRVIPTSDLIDFLSVNGYPLGSTFIGPNCVGVTTDIPPENYPPICSVGTIGSNLLNSNALGGGE